MTKVTCEPVDVEAEIYSAEVMEFFEGDGFAFNEAERKAVADLFLSKERFEQLYNSESEKHSLTVEELAETKANAALSIEQTSVNLRLVEKAMGELQKRHAKAQETIVEERKEARFVVAQKLADIADLERDRDQLVESRNSVAASFENMTAQRDAVVIELAEAAKHRDALQEAVGNLADEVKLSKRNIISLEGEINQLRDKLFEVSMDLARMRGYIQAMEEQKSPRMVPEVRNTVNFERNWQADTLANGAGILQTHKWFHK